MSKTKTVVKWATFEGYFSLLIIHDFVCISLENTFDIQYNKQIIRPFLFIFVCFNAEISVIIKV